MQLDQNREQVVQIPWSIFISKNYQNGIWKWLDDDQRCQVVRRYGISQTSVLFRYQLKCLCDVLSWSVSLRYQLVRHYDVSNWSVLFTYQWDVTKASQIAELTYKLRRHDDVSAWSGKFKLVTEMGQFLLCTVDFLGVTGGSVFLRYQLVRCYNVSKTSVSFRYQLWRLCDMLSWSVSLRY